MSARKVEGIAAVTDLTDREHGLRLVIEVKSGINPEAVLDKLYSLTPLEESFSINNVALVDGQPRQLGLKEMLKVWIEHRVEVVRRRSEYRLKARADRLHLVEGLLIAILDIDEVIRIIRGSDDVAAAKQSLMTTFDLSDEQSEYILELKLRRLTKFSRVELEKEKAQLLAQIADLEDILASRESLEAVVAREMDAVAAEHGSPRRTILLADSGAAVPAAKAQLEIPDSPCFALLSATGLEARTADDHPVSREGRRHAHDVLRSVVASSTRSELAAVTSAGRALRLSLLDVPSLPPTDEPPSLGGGVPISELVPLAGGERVLALVPIDDTPIALGTASGEVKRLTLEDAPARDSWDVISLKDGDSVVGVAMAEDDAQLVFITDDSQLLRFGAEVVRPQGRNASGMAGIKVGDGANVLFFGAVSALDVDPVVVTVAGPSSALPGTTPGTAKITPLSEYPAKGRATGGVRSHKFLRDEDVLLAAWTGPAPARATSAAGQAVELPVEKGKRDGSGTPLAAPVHGLG